MKNIFVFVVCGAQEHIDTLHFSLEYLKKYSENEILVLTDSSRNEIAIEHDKVIDITTPQDFNHHQASIYLKTGIHKFLPQGNNYCYLDSDVVALNNEVDLIFNEFKAPITFAPDHCTINQFSPYAINCRCLDKWEKDMNNFQKLSQQYFITEVKIQNKILKLKKILNAEKKIFTSIWNSILFKLSIDRFKLTEEFFFNKKLFRWELKDGTVLLYDNVNQIVAIKSGYTHDLKNDIWFDKNGINVLDSKPLCEHLTEQILKDFKVDITTKNWTHWNGGVFLFNDESHHFLETWHQKTIKIFNLHNWKIRDQGTLITTICELKLEKHFTLNSKWNFLADFNNDKLDFNKEGFFTENAWKSQYKVNFIHIYHEWGNKNWNLWNWVENKLYE